MVGAPNVSPDDDAEELGARAGPSGPDDAAEAVAHDRVWAGPEVDAMIEPFIGLRC